MLNSPSLSIPFCSDETHAQVHQHFTNDALAGKKVVGLYFSAGELESYF